MVEVERPNCPARRRGKSDELDALSAARDALAMSQVAAPRFPDNGRLCRGPSRRSPARGQEQDAGRRSAKDYHRQGA